MCGIAGIIDKTGKVVDRSKTDLLDKALTHRGPDGSGLWMSQNKSVALIHRRLAILDLTENATQPMLYGGKYVIVFNGEIYNFIEIRNELKKKGHTFLTESDTEVILAAYAEWKEQMLPRFNGMWAIAIYNIVDRTLFLSRDRFSVKPLYYINDGTLFAFASEIQALHKLLGNKADLDQDVIMDISRASFLYHGGTKTYLKNVLSLPGGYNIHLFNNQLKISKWYDLQKVEVPKKLADQADYLRDLLFDACKLRLRSDVAIATCLSGGIDSGSITSIIQLINQSNDNDRFNHYSHKSFLASFPGSVIDERKAAEELARKVGNELDVLDIIAPSATELDETIKMSDGPAHALAFYPILKLYKYIRSNGIKVTLDGQGPDEMLGGYRPIHHALITAFRKNNLLWGIDAYKTYAAQGDNSQFSSSKYVLDSLKFVLKEKIKQNLKGKRLGFLKIPFPVNLGPVRNEALFSDPFNDNLYQQFFYSPLPAILNQYDRCSMASGVECRMPFMDYRIVEYIFSLPTQSKVGGGYTKRVLREAMKGILPDNTRLNKIKIGFNAPIVDWFKGPMKEYMQDTMNSTDFLQSRYFDGRNLKSEYEAFLKNSQNNFEWNTASKFWPAVHITKWIKTFNP